MTKVAFFTTGMTAGGAERVVSTLANDLDSRGFEVIVAILKGQDSAYALSANVRLSSAKVTPGLKNLIPSLRFYRQLARREEPDVIVSFSWKTDVIALLGRLLFGLPHRLIVSERADPYNRKLWIQFVCNFLYQWSDAVVCQSQAVADYYTRKCERAETWVIPNPVEEACIGEPYEEVRTNEVISVGRLTYQKNHRLAIDVFCEVKKLYPALTLKIYGTGPLDSELREYIRALGMRDSISLEGLISNVARHHSNAALFLFTSNYEGYPNALLEAAATGIPTVTTDFSPGTASEIICDTVSGYIAPVGDKTALVQASIKALSGCIQSQDCIASAHRLRSSHHVSKIQEAWLSVFSAG